MSQKVLLQIDPFEMEFFNMEISTVSVSKQSRMKFFDSCIIQTFINGQISLVKKCEWLWFILANVVWDPWLSCHWPVVTNTDQNKKYEIKSYDNFICPIWRIW